MKNEYSEQKRKYSFSGSVLVYSKVAAWGYSAATWAVNPQKARCNMAYQYKLNNNLAAHVPVKLQGVLTAE